MRLLLKLAFQETDNPLPLVVSLTFYSLANVVESSYSTPVGRVNCVFTFAYNFPLLDLPVDPELGGKQ
ncbi:hypothetical protein [Spirosoma pomorum]